MLGFRNFQNFGFSKGLQWHQNNVFFLLWNLVKRKIFEFCSLFFYLFISLFIYCKMLSMRIFCGFCIIFLFIHSFYSNIVLQLKWYLRKQVHMHRAYTLDRACLDENIQMIKQAPFLFFHMSLNVAIYVTWELEMKSDTNGLTLETCLQRCYTHTMH